MSTETEPTQRPYGGASAPERRAARRARLTEATLDLVAVGGVAALTVGAVCGRAGVAKRYFYESFASLDDLAAETLADALQGMSADITRRAQAVGGGGEGRPAPVAPFIEGTVRAVLDAFDDPRLARLYLEAPGHPGLRRARDAATSVFVDQLLLLLTGREVPAPSAVLEIRVVVAGTTDAVSSWLRGEIDLGREEVVRVLVALGTDSARRIVAASAVPG